MDNIEIALNKRKLSITLIGSIILTGLGLWLVITAFFIDRELGNLLLMLGVGMAVTIFFGLCTFVASAELIDPKPGLLVDSTGITDNSGGISAGHIPWHDVKGIEVKRLLKQQFLIIIVYNPDDYINRQTSPLKRESAAINLIESGSPVCISANALKADFEKLKTVLQTLLDTAEYKRMNSKL